MNTTKDNGHAQTSVAVVLEPYRFYTRLLQAWFKSGPFQVTVRIFHGPVGADRLTVLATR